MAEAENNAGQPAAGGGKKGLIAFVAIGLFALVSSVTVGLLAFPDKHKGDEAGKHEEAEVKVTSLLPVPQILVNLRDSNGQRLLQAAVSLELLTPKADTVQAVFNEMLPKIQDQLIKIMSAYSAGDLDGGNRKDALQSRLMKELNENLFAEGEIEVAGVYFTEFVVQ